MVTMLHSSYGHVHNNRGPISRTNGGSEILCHNRGGNVDYSTNRSIFRPVPTVSEYEYESTST